MQVCEDTGCILFASYWIWYWCVSLSGAVV